MAVDLKSLENRPHGTRITLLLDDEEGTEVTGRYAGVEGGKVCVYVDGANGHSRKKYRVELLQTYFILEGPPSALQATTVTVSPVADVVASDSHDLHSVRQAQSAPMPSASEVVASNSKERSSASDKPSPAVTVAEPPAPTAQPVTVPPLQLPVTTVKIRSQYEQARDMKLQPYAPVFVLPASINHISTLRNILSTAEQHWKNSERKSGSINLALTKIEDFERQNTGLSDEGYSILCYTAGCLYYANGEYYKAINSFFRAADCGGDQRCYFNIATVAYDRGHSNLQCLALLEWARIEPTAITRPEWLTLVYLASRHSKLANLLGIMERYAEGADFAMLLRMTESLLYVATVGKESDTVYELASLLQIPDQLTGDLVLALIRRNAAFRKQTTASHLEEIRTLITSITRELRLDLSPNQSATSKPRAIPVKSVQATCPISPASTTENSTPNEAKVEQTGVTVKSPVSSAQRQDYITRGNRAATENDLGSALNFYHLAYNTGDHSSNVYYGLAHTLQRLQNYDEALAYLDEGIKLQSSNDQVRLLTLKAQIHSSQQQWNLAAEAYCQLLKLENRRGARRAAQMQLVSMYLYSGDNNRAKALLKELVKDDPFDQVVQRKLSALESASTILPQRTGADDGIEELRVDLEDQRDYTNSPFLKRDLATTPYTDEKIVSQGNEPRLEDAERLLKEAVATKGDDFFGRYPLFLQAAKAFYELPFGTSDTLSTDAQKVLSRYAALKGGAIVSDLRDRISSSQTMNREEGKRLRDTAASYYLESLVFQAPMVERGQVSPATMLIALRQYLNVLVGFALWENQLPLPEDVFNRTFTDQFSFCFGHDSDEIARIAYEAVVACGSNGGRIWTLVSRLRGGPGVLWNTMDTAAKRSRPYRILSALSGEDFNVEQKPGEVLTRAFRIRADRVNAARSFVETIKNIAFTSANFSELARDWQKFPESGGAMTDTDLEILRDVGAILATLEPYSKRGGEERTNILFKARTLIAERLQLINKYPTRLGRECFEPLLLQWQERIRDIERQRLREVQPKLSAQLEPVTFAQEGDKLVGGIRLKNEGRGTAEKVRIRLQLKRYSTEEILYEYEYVIDEEIGPRDQNQRHGGTLTQRLEIAADRVPVEIRSECRLYVQIAPFYQGRELDAVEEQFTLEVSSDISIEMQEIPWNEQEPPSLLTFKGREDFIEELQSHFASPRRSSTWLLYGLTRTGKTSILKFLRQKINLTEFELHGQRYRFICFQWHMGKADAHRDAAQFWKYLLCDHTIAPLQELCHEGKLPEQALPTIDAEDVGFRNWDQLISHLHQVHLYPIFLLDEFSYIRNLIENNIMGASHLSAMREYALEGRASFVYAGTYDLHELISKPEFGITGQFVHTIEKQVSTINREPAIELMRVMETKLRFTDDAIEHILALSYRLPYFIQLICKNCAYFAVHWKRNIMGYPEVETVVKALVGEDIESVKELIPPTINPLGELTFQDNLHHQHDPPEFHALISTLCDHSRGQLNARPMTYNEIKKRWHSHNITKSEAILSKAISELVAREVLIEVNDEGVAAYQISVDLFRRWWAAKHRDLAQELDKIK
jgi:tetratricopeptide (TPR) repeat protein